MIRHTKKEFYFKYIITWDPAMPGNLTFPFTGRPTHLEFLNQANKTVYEDY